MYSDDIKKIVIKKIEEGMSLGKASRLFNIGKTTIHTWKKEGIKQRVKKSYIKKINPEELKSYIEKNPDAYLSEIAQTAIRKRLKNLGITRKKDNNLQRAR